MDRFHTFFGLKLSFHVSRAMEQLSRTLQYSDIIAQEATLAATKAVHFLRRQRSEQSFVLFYHAAVEQAKDLTQTPCLSRQRQLPRRLDDGASNHQFLIPEDYFHKQYFEVLDLLVCEQERSFDQESFKCLQDI